MATAQTALQTLINALQAVAATTPAGDSEAKRSVLLAAAIAKLSETTTLEAEVLATVEAILDSFEAQGAAQVIALGAASTAQVTAIDAATAALITAKNALATQSASITTLLNRRGNPTAMSTGIPSVVLSKPSNNSAAINLNFVFSFLPTIYDKRVAGGRLMSSGMLGTATGNDYPLSCIRGHAAGVTTSLYQDTSTYRPRTAGEVTFFLPLAKSATDATTKATSIIFSDMTTDSYTYPSFWQTTTMRNEDNWNAAITTSTAADQPQRPFFAYDKVNKTLVYIAWENQGNYNTIGEPSPTARVLERFANGTVRAITGYTGWKGFLSYIYSNTARFIKLMAPEEPTGAVGDVWAAGYAQYARPSRTMVLGGSQVRQNGTLFTKENGDQGGGFDWMGRLLSSGAYGWYAGGSHLNFPPHQTSFWDGERDPYTQPNHTSTLGGFNSPMWVIEADGSINLHRIYYHPRFSRDLQWHSASYTYIPATVWDGYDFAVLDEAKNVIANGWAPLDASMKMATGTYGLNTASGRKVGQFFPTGFHIADNVLQSLVGTTPQVTALNTNAVDPALGALTLLVHQKLMV